MVVFCLFRDVFRLGANEVIPEEFETSVEIFTRVLNKFMVPRDEIEQFLGEVRSDSYEMFRSFAKKTPKFSDLRLHVPDIEISSVRVMAGSTADGKTLGDLALRKKHGVSALAVRRNGAVFANPHGDTKLEANDVVIVVAPKSRIVQVSNLFRGE